jgi:hypothetical protein
MTKEEYSQLCERYEKAHKIVRELTELETILWDAESFMNNPLFTYDMQHKFDAFKLSKTINEEFLAILKRHKEQLLKEFEEL